MKSSLFFCAAFLLAASAARGQSTATLMGLDVYRSATVTAEAIQKAEGAKLAAYVRLRNDGRQSSLKNAERLKAEIEADVRRLGDLAYASLYWGEYLSSAKHTAYVTFDVVDSKDAKERMPFASAPRSHRPDPVGLLAAWRDYYELGTALMKEGSISTDHASCPGYYCLWGAATPELAELQKRFVTGCGPNKKALVDVVHDEAEPQLRAAALYVLAYLPDGREVADLMTDALHDPAQEVRAAALQVLSEIAVYHKNVYLEVSRIIPALDFPTTSDRSKALGALIGVADNATYRPYILTRATPYLVPLLKMQQPGVHDLAFTLLSLLSQETYGRRDYAAWDKWVAAQTSTAAPPPRASRRRFLFFKKKDG